MSHVESLYGEAVGRRRAAFQARDRQHFRISMLRLAIAASAIAILLVGGLDALPWLLLPLGAFVLAAFLQARILNARDRAASAVAFYERGLARIRHQWIGHGRPGDAHRQADHPFADDLDVFGRGSLFELLATTRTRAGEEVLARWLLTPATGEEARARQEAVRELAGRLDLREAVAVLGDQVHTAVDAAILRQWAHSPIRLTGTTARAILFILVAVTLTLLVNWSQTGRFGGLALVALGAQMAAAYALRGRVATVVGAVDEPAHDLDVLAALLRLVEQQQFTSPRLAALQHALTHDRQASHEIARLSQLVALLESRHNVLFALPAAFMLWTTQWAFAIEAWRTRTGTRIPAWLDAVGELEALLAIGGFAAEHPAFVYPDIADGPPVMVATDLAHPAIGADAVANDVHLTRGGLSLLIVSGSNMSGKSTWLRTLGTTVVLSWMGAPVRARQCRLSPMSIGASIRALDSLTDGRSRFYAEILRLKAIVDVARATDGAVLFLLDEILGGTNSHDRRIGAEALVTGLVNSGAIGLVTTHDLALSAIADRLGATSANAHFSDRFVDGALRFDYRLTPGPVTTSNALALMRSIGLEV